MRARYKLKDRFAHSSINSELQVHSVFLKAMLTLPNSTPRTRIDEIKFLCVFIRAGGFTKFQGFAASFPKVTNKLQGQIS